MRSAAALLAFTSMALLQPVAAAEPGVEQLAWLAGCWKLEGADAGSGEQWLPPAGGTMFGVSRTVRDGRTVMFEFMQVRRLEDGTLAFLAQPTGQPATAFPLVRLTSDEVMFENRGHDFPQRVIYARVDDSRLAARIEGQIDGRPQSADFPLVRVPCEQLAAEGK